MLINASKEERKQEEVARESIEGAKRTKNMH